MLWVRFQMEIHFQVFVNSACYTSTLFLLLDQEVLTMYTVWVNQLLMGVKLNIV